METPISDLIWEPNNLTRMKPWNQFANLKGGVGRGALLGQSQFSFLFGDMFKSYLRKGDNKYSLLLALPEDFRSSPSKFFLNGSNTWF